MELHDVVKKLVGEIEPVGETHADEVRYENLKLACDLADQLLSDIYRVTHNRTRVEYSMKRAGDYAATQLNALGDYTTVLKEIENEHAIKNTQIS